ncbi:helix-turn-helix domain-containing protein [Clostridium botulinum]|uniref:helix-turn-helix domain-containing protein n=1 Tax=Clostridium botulinum TaxID=1491 RepID=UPI000774A41A|nr:helix-turn-helix domain-containing protein [Clostridium botulinum]NFN09377.1 helix-turn-helix transcriptional regulator [Clostridium botulinum]NFN32943.1 helix-turn-helix transcriptional regulator [Clostridium botulinum]
MFKDKIKAVRKDLGLTQIEFAKRLGISRSYLGDLETGRLKGSNVKIISKLSDLSGKSMEYFLGKDAEIKQYEILDSAIEMLLDKNLISSEGEISDKTAENILLEILKKEIKLKIENKR